jgi:CheY-like chemotaxis protein
VKTASDGEEGLRLALETRHDVVLLDMMLPKVPGLEVLRAPKKDPAARDTPVIVLTAFSERNRKKLIEKGAAAYLEKSAKLFENDAATLIESVRRVLPAGPARA